MQRSIDAGKFITDLQVMALPGARWKLMADLVWLEADVEIRVPTGFITDFASVPRMFQWAPHFGVNGRSRKAAVLHDYLYSLKKKAIADPTFRRALAAEGLNRGTCTIYYYAVKWFGRAD